MDRALSVPDLVVNGDVLRGSSNVLPPEDDDVAKDPMHKRPRALHHCNTSQGRKGVLVVETLRGVELGRQGGRDLAAQAPRHQPGPPSMLMYRTRRRPTATRACFGCRHITPPPPLPKRRHLLALRVPRRRTSVPKCSRSCTRTICNARIRSRPRPRRRHVRYRRVSSRVSCTPAAYNKPSSRPVGTARVRLSRSDTDW